MSRVLPAKRIPSDMAALARRLPSNARLCVGDVSPTVPAFTKTLSSTAPLGFAAIDVDCYWSARECLAIFLGALTCRRRVTPICLDDVAFEGMIDGCGERLAVNEFDAVQPLRMITPITVLRQRRNFRNASWIDHMFALHVLDHPARSSARVSKRPVRLENPYL